MAPKVFETGPNKWWVALIPAAEIRVHQVASAGDTKGADFVDVDGMRVLVSALYLTSMDPAAQVAMFIGPVLKPVGL